MSDIFYILSSQEVIYHDVIIVTSSLVTLITGSNVANLGTKSAISDSWPIFIDLWRHVWRNVSDIFYILNITEMFYHDFIIVTSSLDTLVASDVIENKRCR